MGWIRWGSALMALGVALGAFGAHGLSGRLSPASLAVYQTAVFYHLVHALGLLAVGILSLLRPQARLDGAGWLLVAGIALFSGSLYLLSVTGLKKLGMITPIGGLALLAAWIVLFAKS